MSVSVRVTNVLADRRFAICVDRSSSEPWIIEIDAAHKLLRDLGAALAAVERLEPESRR